VSGVNRAAAEATAASSTPGGAGSAAQDRSMTSGASLPAVVQRASDGRTREPAGTLTKLPDPMRLVRKPSARRVS